MKTALVTGTSQGLGQYLAQRLGEQGWRVTGLSRRGAGDQSEAFTHIRCDLANTAALDSALEQIVEKSGGCPDLVVLNAVTYPAKDSESDVADWDRVFQVNTLAPYYMSRKLLSEVRPDSRSTFIIINSEAVFHADEKSAIYAASKAALKVLSTALAVQARPLGVAVASLLLGPLANHEKVEELRRIAERRDTTLEETTKLFLRRSNPDLVIDDLIGFESCLTSVQYLASLGPVANGMLCRLDGGSAGSLV
jgi:NAD(P)-dependent dehydrogenase (short-subunit alcohol dehydrogenase family)